MKKTYMNPTLDVVELHFTTNLLAGSGVGNGDSVGNAVVAGDDYARDNDLDDDF